MVELGKIYNENCFDTMRKLIDSGQTVDLILTSPPYNNPRHEHIKHSELNVKNYNSFYDEFSGFVDSDDYRNWTKKLFYEFNHILSPNGVILYNLSYSANNTEDIWLVVSDIIKDTAFTIVDCIIWKKYSALPNNKSGNRLTRVCEFVFVIARKKEVTTFHYNSIKNGEGMHTTYSGIRNNFIEAPNNSIMDSKINKLNLATFSIELVTELLDMYADDGAVVYDPFMGTGTTAIACSAHNNKFIGSELSSAQCEFANERLKYKNVKRQHQNCKKLF